MSNVVMPRILIAMVTTFLTIVGFVHADPPVLRMVPSGWNDVPGSDLSKYDGFAWYVLPVVIPAEWSPSALRLELGAIDDADETFFDGVRLGVNGQHAPAPAQHLDGIPARTGTQIDGQSRRIRIPRLGHSGCACEHVRRT